MSDDAASALTVDVLSDVVCPWCFIGKRTLEQALALYRAANPERPAPEVRWHAFQLNPELPEEGIARTEYLTAKFGAPDGGGEYERVQAIAAKVDLNLAFDRIARQPNTLRAHALIAQAGYQGIQDGVVEALFQAYFLDAADLSSRDVLREAAVRGGMSAFDADRVLANEEFVAQIAAADHKARELGINAVPFFIFNSKVAVSGAHDAQTLLQAMQKVDAR
jgi:predicted DsbA family dithiol-disulfide isomerase